LRPEFGEDPQTIQHFKQALKTVVTIRHPNLVEHYGAGNAGPFYWISMEYVEGKSLTQVIRRASSSGLADWRQSLGVALDLGRAFQSAHKQGAIHGHLTPQDIMVRDSDKVTKLGDLMLGWTLVKTRRQPTFPRLDGDDDLAYLSPEMIDASQDVDARTDIYGMGAIVYALLTGRAPFTGKSREDTVQKIREVAPIKPVFYQPDVADSFERTVLKMLNKNPADRHQDATELLADLQQTIVKQRTRVSSLRRTE